jgi:ribonuclease HI
MTSLEAAHIIHLLSLNAKPPFGKTGPHAEWISALQTEFKGADRFEQEVDDKRIKIHLEEFTVKGDLSINEGGEWQRDTAHALHTELTRVSSVLKVATDGSFRVHEDGRGEGGGGIYIDSLPPIREACYMGQYVETSGTAELAALLRGLQIVRDTLRTSASDSRFRRYQRIVFTTDALMSLQALAGVRVFQGPSEMQRLARLAALCRIEAHEILASSTNLGSIHFTWLPRMEGGNNIADKLAHAGRLSGPKFAKD